MGSGQFETRYTISFEDSCTDRVLAQVGCLTSCHTFCFAKTRRAAGRGYPSLVIVACERARLAHLPPPAAASERIPMLSQRYRRGTHWSSPPFCVSATPIWKCVVVSKGTRAFVRHSRTFLWQQGRARRARHRVRGGGVDGLRFFLRGHSGRDLLIFGLASNPAITTEIVRVL